MFIPIKASDGLLHLVNAGPGEMVRMSPEDSSPFAKDRWIIYLRGDDQIRIEASSALTTLDYLLEISLLSGGHYTVFHQYLRERDQQSISG